VFYYSVSTNRHSLSIEKSIRLSCHSKNQIRCQESKEITADICWFLLEDIFKTREKVLKPGDWAKLVETESLMAKPGELIGLLYASDAWVIEKSKSRILIMHKTNMVEQCLQEQFCYLYVIVSEVGRYPGGRLV